MPARPDFLLELRFADLDGWWLNLRCCGRTVDIPFRMLAAQKPRARLASLLRALRCEKCGQRPGKALLLDDPTDRMPHTFGAPGGWRIEITLPDRGIP